MTSASGLADARRHPCGQPPLSVNPPPVDKPPPPAGAWYGAVSFPSVRPDHRPPALRSWALHAPPRERWRGKIAVIDSSGPKLRVEAGGIPLFRPRGVDHGRAELGRAEPDPGPGPEGWREGQDRAVAIVRAAAVTCGPTVSTGSGASEITPTLASRPGTPSTGAATPYAPAWSSPVVLTGPA